MSKTKYTQLGALHCIIDDHSRVFECEYKGKGWLMVYEKEINAIRIYNKCIWYSIADYWLDSVWTEVFNEK